MRFLLLASVAGLLASPATAAPGPVVPGFPAAGEVVVPQVHVRRAPERGAPVLRVLGEFRRDFRPRVVLALEARSDPSGRRWYRISMPGRPNGQRGWVRAEALKVQPVVNRIVVRRAARRLEVRRLLTARCSSARLLRSARRKRRRRSDSNFYVQWRFTPTDPFYGPFALETSAYSRLSDWPGGGVVGIHGTSLPELIGQAVSHGCIRMRNEDVVRLVASRPSGRRSTSFPSRYAGHAGREAACAHDARAWRCSASRGLR